MGFFRRWRDLVVAANTPVGEYEDGPCEYCRAFVLSDEGVVDGNSLFCSDECVEDNFAVRNGW